MAVRRHAVGGLERASEVQLGHSAHGRQPTHRPRLMRSAVILAFASSRGHGSAGPLEASALTTCPTVPELNARMQRRPTAAVLRKPDLSTRTVELRFLAGLPNSEAPLSCYGDAASGCPATRLHHRPSGLRDASRKSSIAVSSTGRGTPPVLTIASSDSCKSKRSPKASLALSRRRRISF